jgi:hypothetical protein
MGILDVTKKLDFLIQQSVHLSALYHIGGHGRYIEMMNQPQFVITAWDLFQEVGKWQNEVNRAEAYNAEPFLVPSRSLDPEANTKLNNAFAAFRAHICTRYESEILQLEEEV